MPDSWLNEMSTTMFSIRHLISFTCTQARRTRTAHDLAHRHAGKERRLLPGGLTQGMQASLAMARLTLRNRRSHVTF